MSLLALKRGKVARDPAREALALAINELTGMLRAQEAARRDVDRAKNLRDQAEERFRDASTAAGAARGGYADAMLHAARTGEAFSMSATSQELRRAESDAVDVLEAAKAAVTTLEETRDEAEGVVARKAKHVRGLAGRVVEGAIPRLRERADVLIAELAQLAGAIRFAGRQGQDQLTTSLTYQQKSHAEAFAANVLILVNYGHRLQQELPAADEWVAALDALMRDPDAPLPGAQ